MHADVCHCIQSQKIIEVREKKIKGVAKARMKEIKNVLQNIIFSFFSIVQLYPSP